jgi:cellobiose epimerase
MMSIPKLLATFSFLLLFKCTLKETKSISPIESYKQDIYQHLTNGLLHIWYPRAIDEEMGGYYSSFTYDWQLGNNQNKMIVTQARHVWTTSKAAEMFPENDMYVKAAAHGFRFLKDRMWDHEFGGFYNLVNRQGDPIWGRRYDAYKRTYGNAFAIYALSAYYAVSKNPEALQLAKDTFLWLEKYAFDSQYGGYFPSLTRDGKIVIEETDSSFFYNVGMFYKDQNTTIHLLEAFTELYHVWPDQLVEKRLKELLLILRDNIVVDQGYLQLFFYRDWKPVSFRDSSDAVREQNYSIDHVSFGHDIETAFLMLEASHVLGRFEWDKTLQIAKKMVDHTIVTGFDPINSGIYEQGYYFKNKSDISIVDHRKNWWAQAEGLNALLLFSKLFPNEDIYEQEFLRLWNYTKEYIIDQEHGEWYSYGLDTEPENQYQLKAHIWKGNYHNGRSLMNIIRMMNDETLF